MRDGLLPNASAPIVRGSGGLKALTRATRGKGIAVPHEIDVMVGKRIRQRRRELSLSQTELSKKLGISFQLVQKYELAENRVSCSRLYDFSKALRVSIAYFFPDSAQTDLKASVIERADTQSRKDALRFIKAFSQMEHRDVRARLVALLDSLAVDENSGRE